MAETIREMVVRLSMDAGGFKKTSADIRGQIKNIDKEIKAVGDSSDKTIGLMTEKLAAQKAGIENLKGAVDVAKGNLEKAETAADKLLAAKRLSNLETQLQTATAEAKKLEDKLNAVKLMEFGSLATNFGRTMKRMGRSMSLYVTAPLAALGGKAYKTALDYESATVSMQKTIDETDATKYEDIEASFKEISETAPVAYTELMELAGLAGALGVGADDVVQFVKAIAMISETADDLDAHSGAKALAEFLNITDKGSFKNIDNVSSTITELGNNMNTTEGQITEMALRMAATGTLAGLSQAQILALAASFSSLGIESQAGGSAASKMMKKMQVASEVGAKGYKEFSDYYAEMGLDMLSVRELQLEADDADWVAGMAQNMGKTKKEIKAMISSIVDLDQFAGTMGVTMGEFGDQWQENPAQSMLDFFKGLSELETKEGEETVLARLDAMGLTEVRLSNLIAGAASNPELFIAAMDMADAAYEQNTATFDEAQKRYATAQSQQDVTMNKMENTAADLGENLVDPIQSVMGKVSDLVGKFGELDEKSQNTVIAIAAGFAVGGPIMAGIGTTVSGIGSIATAAGKMIESGTWGKVTGFLSSPVLWGVAAGVGIYLLLDSIGQVEGKAETLLTNLSNIELKLDPEKYAEVLAGIEKVRAESDALSGDKTKGLEGVSQAVKAGYGTSDMYGQALGFEIALSKTNIAQESAKYGAQISDMNAEIVELVAVGEDKLAGELAQKRDSTQAEWDQKVQEIRLAFTKSLSELYAGMNTPENKKLLEDAAEEYDLLAFLESTLTQAMETDDLDAMDGIWKSLFTPAVLENYFNGQKFEELVPFNAVSELRTALIEKLTLTAGTVNEDGSANTFWQAILGDPEAMS